MKKFILLLTLFCQSISAYSQQEWEDAIPARLKWNIDLNLSWYSTSLSDLKVANLIPETKEDKKNNRWASFNAELNYQIKEACPFKFAVDVTNLNNGSDYKYAVTMGKRKKGILKQFIGATISA